MSPKSATAAEPAATESATARRGHAKVAAAIAEPGARAEFLRVAEVRWRLADGLLIDVRECFHRSIVNMACLAIEFRILQHPIGSRVLQRSVELRILQRSVEL